MSLPLTDPERLAARLSARVSRDPLLLELRGAAERTGATLCLVGGYVRDAALGRATADVDLVSGPGCGRVVREIRERFGTRGFRFRRRGVTTWRFRLGSQTVDLVDASRRGIEADLRRRDLTINSIAFDLSGRRIVDPVDGFSDLTRRRLRATGTESFTEDPLRALRVCRFVSQFPAFRLVPDTARAAAAVAASVRQAASERILPELDKLLLGVDPVRGLETLRRLDLRESVLPELSDLELTVAGQGRPDVWQHTLEAIRLASGPRRLPGTRRVDDAEARCVLRWGLLLHDASKPETMELAPDGRPSFHGHEVLGQRRAERLLERLRAPLARRRRIARLIRNHLRPGHLADAGPTPRGLGRLVREMDADLPLLVAHAACDARASGGPDSPARWRRMRAVLETLLALHDRRQDDPPQALVDGRDVMRVTGLEPGPRIGRLLARVRRQQQAGRIRTRSEALAFLQRTVDDPSN